jgi:hypothetical protein
VQANFKRYEELEQFEQADAFEDANFELMDMIPDMKEAQKELRAIRKERSIIELDERLGAITEEEAKAEREFLKGEEDAIIAEFNSTYMKFVSRPKRP